MANHRNKGMVLFSKIFLGLVLAFFYLPIFYIIVFSFNGANSLTRLDGFSLQWYNTVFNSPPMMDSIGHTITIAVFATLVATILGTITAIGLSRCGRILRSSVERVNELPVMNPDIVTGISLLMLFAGLSAFIEKGFWTMLLAHIMFCTPFVILTVMPKLRTMDSSLAEAAMDLGCTPFQAMYKVIIPQIIPSIIAGALIAFTMSFDDFVISYFVTGNGYQNISTQVYTMTKRVNPSINALSSLVILIITVVLLLINLAPLVRNKIKNKGQASK